MAENSKIEWTDHTFNPWIGCMKVSAGCDRCYAESLAKRYGWVEWGQRKTDATEASIGGRERTSAGNWRKPILWNKAAKADPGECWSFARSNGSNYPQPRHR